MGNRHASNHSSINPEVQDGYYPALHPNPILLDLLPGKIFLFVIHDAYDTTAARKGGGRSKALPKQDISGIILFMPSSRDLPA